MAENKPGIMLYFETLQAIAALDAEETKQIISAILHYAMDGETPAFQGTLAAFWLLIQSSIDRDDNKYVVKRLRGSWLTYCRKCKECGDNPLPFDEWQRHVNDTITYREQHVNVPLPTTTPSSAPATTPAASTSPPPATTKYKSKSTGADAPAPAGDSSSDVARHKFGAYGWVRLSDEEYARLLDDLGETELERCITYIDESAQSNGNKNKWKDWNLVIRKCSRDRWGLQQRGGQRQSASSSPMDDLQHLHQMYASEEYQTG